MSAVGVPRAEEKNVCLMYERKTLLDAPWSRFWSYTTLYLPARHDHFYSDRHGVERFKVNGLESDCLSPPPHPIAISALPFTSSATLGKSIIYLCLSLSLFFHLKMGIMVVPNSRG